MNKLKKYSQYIIKEDVETPTEDFETPTEAVDSEIDNLMNKLLEMTKKIQKQTTESINEYFKQKTKDGAEITVGKQYYTYGEYNVTGYAKEGKSKQMIFIIRIDELVDNGYKFNIIKSMSDDTLKIDNDQVDILDDKGNRSKIEDRNIIDGRYMVSSEKKIHLLKPSDEESKDEIADDKVVVDEIDVDERKTIKNEIDKLREKVDKIDDNKKLGELFTRVSESIESIEKEIYKLDKLPKSRKVDKFKKILKVDLKLMKDLQSLITKKIKT